MGRGAVWLRDADIYELPLMIALLSILELREPDTTAFSKSDIEFTVRGNHIHMPRITFNGDAISLNGSGRMDFQSNIDLTFHALVGRDEIQVPILRDLIGGASEQIMQIHVGRTLQDPDLRTEAFPVVSRALQQLEGGLQQGGGAPRASPQARRQLPSVGVRSGNVR